MWTKKTAAVRTCQCPAAYFEGRFETTRSNGDGRYSGGFKKRKLWFAELNGLVLRVVYSYSVAFMFRRRDIPSCSDGYLENHGLCDYPLF